MGLKLENPIAVARGILGDTRSAQYRYSAADLLAYANEAVKELIALAPRFFYSEGEVECVAGETLQSIAYDNAYALVDVLGIVGGGNVIQTTEDTLSSFKPSWPQDAAGPAINWMPFKDDPMRFFIYPKSPTGQFLRVCYVRIPLDFLAAEDTNLPLALAPAIADFIVYRAESRDDEHVNLNRAAQFYNAFVGRFKGAN